jgi:hypothetical protein
MPWGLRFSLTTNSVARKPVPTDYASGPVTIYQLKDSDNRRSWNSGHIINNST